MLLSDLMGKDRELGLAELGLTQARAHLLWELATAESLTQRDLAQRLAVTPRNITGLVDALEQTGFVERTAHPSDRRATVVVLTPAGTAAARRLQAEMDAFAEQLFGDVATTDLDVFARVLGASAQRLSELMQKRYRETS
jgi:DNA-binding MarR family transcriptional regulator